MGEWVLKKRFAYVKMGDTYEAAREVATVVGWRSVVRNAASALL